MLSTVATIDIDQLTIFVAVARLRSFTAAAKALGTQKVHASRVVSRLEKEMGVRLLQRSTRSSPERLRLSLPLGCTQELLPADTARVHLPAPQQIAVFAVVTVFHRVLHHP
jgi:Bacterial regulatory helix-turn-helix protein, lysR family